MPILNIELIKKAVKKINKIKENIVVKKGQVYTIGTHRVQIKSFDGSAIYVTAVSSSSIMHDGAEIVTNKENLIKAIRANDVNIVRTNSGGSMLKKRMGDVEDRSLQEAISNSTTIKMKMAKRGDSPWISSTPFTDM